MIKKGEKEVKTEGRVNRIKTGEEEVKTEGRVK